MKAMPNATSSEMYGEKGGFLSIPLNLSTCMQISIILIIYSRPALAGKNYRHIMNTPKLSTVVNMYCIG